MEELISALLDELDEGLDRVRFAKQNLAALEALDHKKAKAWLTKITLAGDALKQVFDEVDDQS